ncbi:MAG TPA: hypothetical protein VMF13_15180, partial [Luteitalea sp.]|nr:hypothetical protein [Luteitalea sp.]
ELLGPFLAFMPLATPWCRIATVAMFWLFHLGLASTMNIGLFPVFSMVGWLAFLPARFWELLGIDTRPHMATVAAWRSRLTSVVAAACLLYVVLLLAERARLVPRVLPAPVVQAGRALRLQQTWNMFAPDPSRATARYTVVLSMRDGRSVEREAGTAFRSRLFFGYAVGERRDEGALGQSLDRYVAGVCIYTPDADQVELVQHTISITEAGGEPLPPRTIVAASCADARAAVD